MRLASRGLVTSRHSNRTTRGDGESSHAWKIPPLGHVRRAGLNSTLFMLAGLSVRPIPWTWSGRARSEYRVVEGVGRRDVVPRARRTLTRTWRRWSSAAGIEHCRLHDLRHFMAIQMIGSGHRYTCRLRSPCPRSCIDHAQRLCTQYPAQMSKQRISSAGSSTSARGDS